jgi:hypothetical protein
MNKEQGLEVLAQRRIIRTHLVQIDGALAGVHLQRHGKEGYFAIWRGVHGWLNITQGNG